MARIARAALAASSAVSAVLIPPALPRLPAGTCAFTTQAPSSAAAEDASSAEVTSLLFGTAMPAASSNGFAACSSKFIGAWYQAPWRER